MSKIYIIAAASGTGKTSLVDAVVEGLDNIEISVSHTTRPKRESERNGENYYFVDQAEFEAKIKAEGFLEYAKVFKHYYGTPRKWVEDQLTKGKDVILEIDWQGAFQVKKLRPDAVMIFILPPTMQELRKRLEKRNQDDATIIEYRLGIARSEIEHCPEFDYIVVNDQFDVAVKDLRSIIHSHRLLTEEQLGKQRKLLAEAD